MGLGIDASLWHCVRAGRVGKTSLVLRYVNNVFSEKQMATIQASYLSKRVTVDDQTVNLCIWVGLRNLALLWV